MHRQKTSRRRTLCGPFPHRSRSGNGIPHRSHGYTMIFGKIQPTRRCSLSLSRLITTRIAPAAKWGHCGSAGGHSHERGAYARLLRPAFRPCLERCQQHSSVSAVTPTAASSETKRLQPMTNRRRLIRDASCWAVALGVGLALSTKESEAQPWRGPPPRHRGPHWRRGRRWGWGPRRHCWWGPKGRVCRWW